MEKLKVVIISLAQSKERRKHAEQEMSKCSLKWSFLDAVDGRKIDIAKLGYNAKKVKKLTGYELTQNEVGCYLSHLKAWQLCVELNQTTLVLEDDFVLRSQFQETIHSILENLKDWQILRLQALVECKHDELVRFDKFSIVKNTGDPIASTGYMLKPEAAKILIQNSIEIFEPIDHFLEHRKKHGLTVLAVKPYPVTTMPDARSTIHDRPHNRSVKGLSKIRRSLNRLLDRHLSNNPWYPKSP
jgi:glycosyl transferase family 25